MQNICNRHLRMHRIMWMASLLLLAGLLLCPSAVRAQSDDDVAYDKTIDPDKRFPVVDSHKYSCSMTVTAQVTCLGKLADYGDVTVTFPAMSFTPETSL